MPFWLQTPTEVLHHRQLGATLQIWGDIHITKKTLKKHVRLCRLGNLRKITPKKITHPKKKRQKKSHNFLEVGLSNSSPNPSIPSYPYHPIHPARSSQWFLQNPNTFTLRIPTPSPFWFRFPSKVDTSHSPDLAQRIQGETVHPSR